MEKRYFIIYNWEVGLGIIKNIFNLELDSIFTNFCNEVKPLINKVFKSYHIDFGIIFVNAYERNDEVLQWIV